MLTVSPQPGANQIKIADEFYKRLEEVKKQNKSDIEFAIPIDNTLNIRRALSEVKETIVISFVLVVLVIFFFFRNWLIAIRPLIDIPISLIATFFIMYLAGFSINVLTLLAIVLATGLVVDDGIVVTENIFRKLEEGLSLKDAAREGSKEIFFAVISSLIKGKSLGRIALKRSLPAVVSNGFWSKAAYFLLSVARTKIFARIPTIP